MNSYFWSQIINCWILVGVLCIGMSRILFSVYDDFLKNFFAIQAFIVYQTGEKSNVSPSLPDSNFFSTEVHDLDLKATSCNSFSYFCSKFLLIPNLHGSHVILVGNFCSSRLGLEKSTSLIALTFLESGEILFSDFLCPKNISLLASKTHLSLFSFIPDFRTLFMTYSPQCECLFRLASILIWWYRLQF